jgi:hypothetical protein
MLLPNDEKIRNKLREYLRSRRPEDAFNTVFMACIKDELRKRDMENRHIGYENKQSAASWIATLIETVAACQAPEQTATKSESGPESVSAGPFI